MQLMKCQNCQFSNFITKNGEVVLVCSKQNDKEVDYDKGKCTKLKYTTKQTYQVK